MTGRKLLLLPLAVLSLTGCTNRRTIPAREAIAAAYKTMEDAFFRGDAETIAKLYTDDGEWYVPELPVIKGREAIAKAWKLNTGPGGNRLRVEVAEVDEMGDRAHEVGRFTISASDGGVLGAGKYIVIWARQPDGTWLTHRDIFNWDIPPRQP